ATNINRTPRHHSLAVVCFIISQISVETKETTPCQRRGRTAPTGCEDKWSPDQKNKQNKAGTKRSERNKIEVQTEGNEEVEGRDGGKKRSTCCPYAKENASGE